MDNLADALSWGTNLSMILLGRRAFDQPRFYFYMIQP